MRNFTYRGREYTAYRAPEADSIYGALATLEGYAVSESLPEFSEDCIDLLDETIRLAQGLSSGDFLFGDEPNFNLTAQGAIIPGLPSWDEEVSPEYRAWESDPELVVALNYAPGGLAIPTQDSSGLPTILRNVTALDNRACAPRVRWGLVGAVAILGGVALWGLFVRQKR